MQLDDRFETEILNAIKWSFQMCPGNQGLTRP